MISLNGFRFGDANARDDMGGCCGKPTGCWIESKGCVHKVEKAEWQASIDEDVNEDSDEKGGTDGLCPQYRSGNSADGDNQHD